MRVDLRSDTVTRPTTAMRQAMASAEVGDDVFGDDPTVNRLEEVAAERAGMEAALLVPSGTMGNQIAIRVHTRPGDEILAHRDSHPFNWEAGGAAAIAGVQIRPLPGPRGILAVEDVLAGIRPEDPHIAPATLLTVEDTANRGGGTVYELGRLDALTAAAHERGLATHLDGARVFNAVVASGVPLARRTAGFDTVSFCLSKGLGCPVGSLLCGPRDLIHVARRVRKMLGGGMRQAGILAAAGLYALEHHVDRLADDHARAQRLAEGARALGFAVDDPDTNLVFASMVGRSQAVVAALRERGIGAGAVSADTVRFGVHLDVDDAGIDLTLTALDEIVGAWG